MYSYIIQGVANTASHKGTIIALLINNLTEKDYSYDAKSLR